MPSSVDGILSLIAAVLYFILFACTVIRLLRSIWTPYFLIAIFCFIRVAAYSVRAHLDSVDYRTNPDKWVRLYVAQSTLLSAGIIVILLILIQLYRSILPMLRNKHQPCKLGTFLVGWSRLFFIPIVGCAIAGDVFSSPKKSVTEARNGDILRKVSVLGLLAFSLVFLYVAWNYRRKYPNNQYPFNICLSVTALFIVSVIYKIVYTFQPSARNTIWAFFVFSPLIELISLTILAVDLQTHFLGHKKNQTSNDIESGRI